ncbi:MAG: lytic transglycosylase domain-containing protein, partial [Hyphomicrobiales bacterium]|nr:lytic transglycosylase domain-containing protein [Hyphomicrobiales bacterium]
MNEASGALWPALLAAGLLVASIPLSARAVVAEPGADNAIATLCGIVEAAAKKEGLPPAFFTRLIWRESAFRPGAV